MRHAQGTGNGPRRRRAGSHSVLSAGAEKQGAALRRVGATRSDHQRDCQRTCARASLRRSSPRAAANPAGDDRPQRRHVPHRRSFGRGHRPLPPSGATPPPVAGRAALVRRARDHLRASGAPSSGRAAHPRCPTPKSSPRRRGLGRAPSRRGWLLFLFILRRPPRGCTAPQAPACTGMLGTAAKWPSCPSNGRPSS